MVPGVSAIGTGSMSSIAPPSIETRAGGRCIAPVARSREPTKPNFQSSLRPAADADGRAGFRPSGRLGREHAPPGQELAVGDRRTGRHLRRRPGGPVCTRRWRRWCGTSRTSAPSAKDSRAMTWPGSAAFERRRAAAVPAAPRRGCRPWRQVVGHRVGRHAELQGPMRSARACVPGDDDAVDLLGARCRRRPARRRTPPTQRHVARLAELSSHCFDRSSPGVRHRSRNSSVAPPRAERARPARGPSLSAPTSSAAAGVATGRLVGAAGQPGADVGGDHQRRLAAAELRRASAPIAGAHRAAAVGRQHVGGEAQGGVQGGGVGLVDVGRRHRREPQRCSAAPSSAEARAGPPPRPASWCPRRRTPPCGCPCRRPSPATAAIVAPVEPPVGQVGAVRR